MTMSSSSIGIRVQNGRYGFMFEAYPESAARERIPRRSADPNAGTLESVPERSDRTGPSIGLEPWSERDQPLLEQLLGVPEMTEHVGGPEGAEKIAERQARYQVPGSRQYRIVVDGADAGWVGYWEREWLGEKVWETGWSVLPGFQGRGVASEATRQLIEIARGERTLQYVHAYPSLDNAPSNAICRKVGFELMGDYEFEYPKGNFMRCNDWRYDLLA
jgi:RimJ/RimL family protein N-acetyltransferase